MTRFAEYSHIYLQQGDMYCTHEPSRIITVLGPCVSVFLWDEELRGGGANHFLHPQWDRKASPSNKYGDISIKNLIGRMLEIGSGRQNLKAKVFGGAMMPGYQALTPAMAEKNVMIAGDILWSEGIPLVNTCTGGPLGRRISMDTYTGIVSIRKIRNISQGICSDSPVIRRQSPRKSGLN